VQQFGLELLVLADGWKAGRESTETFEDQLKLALVAAGGDPAELWSAPDAALAKDFDPAQDEDVDFDYSAVNWQEGSADDWTRMQEVLADSRVQVSSGEMEPADEPEVPDVDFDREWQ
jgi:hypothetical protein